MARRLGRPLLLAYITSPSIFCEPLSGQVIAPVRDSDETHRWLLAELDEVCDREGLDVRIVTRQGSPARELAAAADEFGADALVIGAPARIWHQVAGSVPGWLARHAHCPVIVVRERGEPSGQGPEVSAPHPAPAPGTQTRIQAVGRSGR
jgi:nucleotide-binding universal stress UspA family protein